MHRETHLHVKALIHYQIIQKKDSYIYQHFTQRGLVTKSFTERTGGW